MGYFQVRYDSRVIIYEHKLFIRLATGKYRTALFLKMGKPRPLFHLFLSFQIHTTIFTTNNCEKMSIHYIMPGFELMTFET